jgi:hypothetical protein
MATLYSPKIVTDGLVLALDVANVKSYAGTGTVWNDLSGNGNTGTLTNGPTFDSGNGGNIVFDGVNDFVAISDSNTLNISSTITLQCIFYINSYINWAGIVGRNNNTKSVYSINLSPTSQRLRFNYNNVSPWTSNVESTSIISTGQWIHSAVTYDGTNVRIYLNGNLDKTQNIGAITFDTSSGFAIDVGYDNPGSNEYLNGNISQVLIYSRALTPQEVLQNFNATRGRYGV